MRQAGSAGALLTLCARLLWGLGILGDFGGLWDSLSLSVFLSSFHIESSWFSKWSSRAASAHGTEINSQFLQGGSWFRQEFRAALPPLAVVLNAASFFYDHLVKAEQRGEKTPKSKKQINFGIFFFWSMCVGIGTELTQHSLSQKRCLYLELGSAWHWEWIVPDLGGLWCSCLWAHPVPFSPGWFNVPALLWHWEL